MMVGEGCVVLIHLSLSLSHDTRDASSVAFGSSFARHTAAARGGFASRPGPLWAGVVWEVEVNQGGGGMRSGSPRDTPVFLPRSGSPRTVRGPRTSFPRDARVLGLMPQSGPPLLEN